MAEEKKLKELLYEQTEDYDSSVRINKKEVPLYSAEKMAEKYPKDNFALFGHTWESKKQEPGKDIGRIELADKILFVKEGDGRSGFLKKRAGYVKVENGGYIALFKRKIWPLFLLFALLIVGIGASAYYFYFANLNNADIMQANSDGLTISGHIYKDGKALENLPLSLQKGNNEVKTAKTDQDGYYLITNVENKCSYNLLCTLDDNVLTKIATVQGESIIVDFTFPKDDFSDIGAISGSSDNLPKADEGGKAESQVQDLVKIVNASTPAIAVGELEKEAMLHMVYGKSTKLTFEAEQVDEKNAVDKDAIKAITGELDLKWLNFRIVKEISSGSKTETSEQLNETTKVLEVAIPYNTANKVDAYVFRSINGNAQRFEKLTEKPTENYQDGTYYVTKEIVFVYIRLMGSFAVGSVDSGSTQSTQVLSYDYDVSINSATGDITLYYENDINSDDNVRVELYLTKTNGEGYLIASSGVLKPGYKIQRMSLRNGASLPSTGVYSGLMRIVGLDANNEDSDKQVDIPVTVTISNQ